MFNNTLNRKYYIEDAPEIEDYEYDAMLRELEDLEKKASKGKLSAAEVQYGDMLAHFKKNLLTADAMEDSDYSNTYYRDGVHSSYARGRGARRDSMGRYSRNRYSRDYSEAVDGMVEQLKEMMNEAPDAETKSEIQRLVTKFEKM